MDCIVIMAGGRGERFWPKSRVSMPKQFTDFTGNGSMLSLTYTRLARLADPERIFVVTGREYRALTLEQLPGIPEDNIIIEPEGRNTAPCIGLAAVTLQQRFGNPTMIVVPADHMIKEEDRFIDTLQAASALARASRGLVTVGITPTRPETGYGYLKIGEKVDYGQPLEAYKVSRFVEKPDTEKALAFLEEGGYLWNAGIFVWQVSAIMQAFKQHLPEMFRGLTRIGNALAAGNYGEVLNNEYPGFERVSIDYGIMEKVGQVFTVPGDFYWDDVGTWKSLERILETDARGNVLRGNIVALDTVNTIVDAGERLVALIGVEGLLVVETEDITFICSKDQTDKVRELLAELRSQNMRKYL